MVDRILLSKQTICCVDGIWDVAEFFITKNGKEGVLSKDGDIIIPCVYDTIKKVDIHKYEVVKNGIKKIIDLWPRRHDFYFKQSCDSPSCSSNREGHAQDEMGYSDDDIDTIFDGDPSAYWNID